MTTKKEQAIAVCFEELRECGCPSCGYRSGSSNMSGNGGMIWTCGDCGKTCIALAKGIDISPFGMGHGDDEVTYPQRQSHPRLGIPAHGKPDIKPETGGEFFHSRGIGLEGNLSCFCCGSEQRTEKEGYVYLNNIAAFVQCKEAGERVIKMFTKGGARLDYRESEPDRVQIKIGACDKHLSNLQRLDKLTKDGVITEDMINNAIMDEKAAS